MRFNTLCSTLLLALLANPTVSSPLDDRGTPNPMYTTPAWREKFVANYLSAISGNYSLIPEVFQSNVQIIQDRNCLETGSEQFFINSTAATEEYIKLFTAGFSYFNTALRYYIAQDYVITIQWRIDAIVSNIAKVQASATAQAGHYIHYNGTDTVFLNKTTGQVYFDQLFFNHNSNQYQLGWQKAWMASVPNAPGQCPMVLGAPSCPKVLTSGAFLG